MYALLGTSRHLSVQATSATAALIASTVVAMGVSSDDVGRYVATASALVIVVGAVFFLAGVLRLGFVSQFLSRPVMDGFVTGLAVFVAVGQLNKLFGVSSGSGNTFQKFGHIIRELPQTNGWALAMGLGTLAVLVFLPRIARRLPAGLVVLFGGIAVSAALDLETAHGVDVVGSLPQGLPTPSFPDIPLSTWVALVPAAIGIVLVAYSEALGVAREFAAHHGYEIDPDQELIAHGGANVVSGLLGGMIAGGGMSASAVKEGAGARSQVANLVAWGATIVTRDRADAAVQEPAAGGARSADHPGGLAPDRGAQAAADPHAGALRVGARRHDARRRSLLRRARRDGDRPRPVVADRHLPGLAPADLAAGQPIRRHPARTSTSTPTRRPSRAPARSSCAPTSRSGTRTRWRCARRCSRPLAAAPATRAVVLGTSSVGRLDVTTADVLQELAAELRKRGVGLWIGGLHPAARDFAERSGLAAALGEGHIAVNLDGAVRAAEQASHDAYAAAPPEDDTGVGTSPRSPSSEPA